MKRILKKIFSNKFILILLAIFLFFGTITFSAFNISNSSFVDDNLFGADEMNIALSESGDTEYSAWTFEYRKFFGSVAGEKGGCNEDDKSHNSTLTLTYNGDSDATISFNYSTTLNGGIFKINDEQKADGKGEYKIDISEGEIISFYIESAKGNNTTTINVSEFRCALNDAYITLTMKQPINGSYTISYGETALTITEESEIEVLAGTKITLKAVPNNGYGFTKWVFNGVSHSTELEVSVSLDIDTVIEANFLSDLAAIFSNNGILYYSLDEAIESAKQSSDKIILQTRSGTIEGGSSGATKSYIIPNGVALYIPDDNSGDKTMHTDGESVFYNTGYVIPKCYIELQIPSYTEIVVESGGYIYVDSTACGQMQYNGAPSKAYGKIHLLDSSSKITLNSGGKLYCYGYITGAGLVDALNGSEVYEFFQISDFRGGDTSLSMKDNGQKVFYFNNYYIQNIEARLIMNYGSVEYVSTASYLKKGIEVLATTKAAFISSTDSDSGLFRLHNNSSLEKRYNGDLDRLEIKLLSGEADFSSIALSLKVLIFPLDMNSENFVLPFNNNMTITICSGSTVNITKDICLLPGTELIVEEGATINVTDGASIYFYDRESWVGKKFCVNNVDFHSVRYAVSKKYNRTSEDLKSAILNNDGTITINTGAGLYTTRSSSDSNYNNIANVFSSNGTGVFQFSGTPGSKTITYQYSGDFVGINVSYLLLRNSMNQNPNELDTTFDLNGVSDLTDKNIYFDLIESQWKLRTFDEKTFEISFVDNTYNNETYKSYFTVGENFVFPTAEKVNFINGIYKVRKWKIEGVGLFKPGEPYTLDEARNLTVIAIYGGRTNNGSDVYYVDYYSDSTPSGLVRTESREDSSKTSIYKFLEGGLLDYSYSGIYSNEIDNYSYYIEGGMVIETEGFRKISSEEGLGLFNYIFISSNNTLLTNGTFYIDLTSSLLPSGYYAFDENGYIFREDSETSNSNGEVYIKENKTYIDGIKVSYGLFEYDGYYYYSNNYGEIVTNQTFFITKVNDTGVQQGLYYFDEQGRMYNQNFELWEVNNA